MKVPSLLLEELKKQGIEVYVNETAKAVTYYNSLDKKTKKVIAGLHLTC